MPADSVVLDGFWLPGDIRRNFISAETSFAYLTFARGQPASAGTPGAVTARYPLISPPEWRRLVEALYANRQKAPRGSEFWTRLQIALASVGQRFADPKDPLARLTLEMLPAYTGYSSAMIQLSLRAIELISPANLPAAIQLEPSLRCIREWQSMPGLPGRLRFYPSSPAWRLLSRLPVLSERRLMGKRQSVDMVIGYGAGNVPGTALLIGLLAQSTTLNGQALPAILIKNSRREPIFSPLVFAALEAVDPQLVASLAVLVWDYADAAIQEVLLSQASLVIAAAGDETISQIAAQVELAGRKPAPGAAKQPAVRTQAAARLRSRPARFHAHGHKVSFASIGKQALQKGLANPATGQDMLAIVALLAALDSFFWDQNGCLSARFHFVEDAGDGYYTPLDYAHQLETQARWLSAFLPRGAWPRQHLHDRFDRYKLLESAGQVRVLSGYDDPHLIVFDSRPPDRATFLQTVNECQGRVIFVRPVADWMEIPPLLGLLPRHSLQSLSVATGGPHAGLDDAFLRFAAACGEKGVTAIRAVGRGAFPQLSHSWDGLTPLDLIRQRPAGYFTTIELDHPWDEMLETYRRITAAIQGAASGSFAASAGQAGWQSEPQQAVDKTGQDQQSQGAQGEDDHPAG